MKPTMIWALKNSNINLKRLGDKSKNQRFISQAKVKSMSFPVLNNKLQKRREQQMMTL